MTQPTVFSQAIPVLAALDIPETLAFYESKFGFTKAFAYPNYGGVTRGGINIHFWHCDDRHIAENTSCYIYVQHIDALYAELQATGVIHPNGPLETKPYGMKEFATLDNNGNMIKFGEQL